MKGGDSEWGPSRQEKVCIEETEEGSITNQRTDSTVKRGVERKVDNLQGKLVGGGGEIERGRPWGVG